MKTFLQCQEKKNLKYYPVFLDILEKKCVIVGGE